MAEKHLSSEEFFTRLSILFTATHTTSSGSIFLTQKPLASASFQSSSSPNPSQVLVRATNGKSKPHRKKGQKEKISTIVDTAGLATFYARYAEVCKKGMTGLRKRDKKKAKKKKGKGAAVAKKG